MLFLLFTHVSAQKKWYQQKNSEFRDFIKVDGNPGSEIRESSGVFLDFTNDGLKDFIIPSYYDVVGSPDVFVLRFFKNMGNGKFKEVTDSIKNPDITSGKFLVGFGFNTSTVFDFNKDGKMDMIFTNGWENQNYSNYDSRFGFVKMRDYFYKDIPSNYIESRANGGYPASAFYYQSEGTFKSGNKLFDTKIFTQDYAVQHSDMSNDGFEDLLIYQNGYRLDANDNIVDWLVGITLWMNDAGKGFKFNHLKLTDSVNKFRFGNGDLGGSIGIGDFNGDGFKDILLFGTKAPYKARTDISPAQQDSVLWDANYITEDAARKNEKVVETRIYFSDHGVFSGSNYIAIPGLRAMYSQSVDLNNDGKTDILAVWKNNRAGGYNGVYIDSISNKDGINNQYYAYINKGNNQFEDQTANYFPYDTTKFSRLGRGDFYLADIDGDGKKDFIPTNNGDDTLRDTYTSFAIDPIGSHSTFYYKNYNNQYFKKIAIDSFPRVLDWKNYPILKNIDSMYAQFYGQATLPLIKNEYLLDDLYYLNNISVEDLNNDGKNEIIGLKSFNNGVNDFLNSKYNYQNPFKFHYAFSTINQCETPKLSSYILPVCGTDTLSTRNIKIINFNPGDSIFWNYNNNIIKTTVDSFKVKELGWVVVFKKDSTGCLSYNSDTLYIKNSPKPSSPRVYGSNNTVSDANNICIGDKINLAADPANSLVTGTILWYDNSKQLSASQWGGVTTLYEIAGNRNITTSSKIQVDTSRNIYTRFLSDEGCYSDTSNFFKIAFKTPLPIVRDTAYCNNINADTLRVTPNSGNTLLWYGTNATGGIGSNTAIKPNTSNIGISNYYVSQVNTATGCEGPRAKLTVTVSAIPTEATITGLTTVCVGSTTTLSNTTTGGVWTSATPITATVSVTGVVTGVAAGTSVISYTVTNAIGCVTTVKQTLTVNTVPSTPTIVWNGTQFTATTTSTGIDYQWLLSNSAISGATSANYKPTAIGSYKIQITDANACKNVSDSFMLVVTAVDPSIETSTDHIAKIVPNPASTNVLLHFSQKPNQTLTIQLLNLKGQVLKQTNTNSQSTRISLSEIIAGNYIIQIIGKGYNQTQQLLITQ